MGVSFLGWALRSGAGRRLHSGRRLRRSHYPPLSQFSSPPGTGVQPPAMVQYRAMPRKRRRRRCEELWVKVKRLAEVSLG